MNYKNTDDLVKLIESFSTNLKTSSHLLDTPFMVKVGKCWD